jgi:hypothetical protein
MVTTIQTAKIHGLADERMGVRASEGPGAGAEGQVTIPERAERACVSLDARDRAGMAIRSSRRVTTRTSDSTIRRFRLDQWLSDKPSS